MESNFVISDFLIADTDNIRTGIQKIDANGHGIVFIQNKDNQLIGLITDGDFRRAVLKGISLNDLITDIINRDFLSVNENYNYKSLINLFLTKKVNVIPILSDKNELIDIKFKKDFDLIDKVILPDQDLDNDVVIMAGGKGTRMAPFTNIFPKPLIPVGNHSMLEVIMNQYKKFGFNNFKVSINYKGNLIKAYLDELDHQFNVSYIEEKKFLGTAGALNLYKPKSEEPFFVSNCDILIKENYLDILNYHNENNNDLTLVAALVHFKVPYGVCKIKNGGELINISEKPEFDNLVNTGMYVLSPKILKLIPEDEFFHITHLIDKIKLKGGKVGVYPVSEKSWLDVGQWKEYEKVLKDF